MKNRETDGPRLKAQLYQAILSLENVQECADFLTDLCTPAELEELADRWQVAQMLCDKTPYRTIAEETGVSVTTVTRVARFLHGDHQGYMRILKRMGKIDE